MRYKSLCLLYSLQVKNVTKMEKSAPLNFQYIPWHNTGGKGASNAENRFSNMCENKKLGGYRKHAR